MFRTFALLVLATGIGGCASIQPVSPTIYQLPSTKTEHKIDTSYQLGISNEVFVGERMLRVQDYYVTTSESGASSTRLLPTENFTIKIPPLMSVSLSPQDAVTIVGTTARDGVTYRLVSLPDPLTQQLRFLITDEGGFEGSAVNMTGARMGWSYIAKPQTVRLVPAPSSSQIDATKGFTNFELVYGGTTRESFQLLYREYTQNDLARPAFSQTLVYDKDSATIRFRNLQIEVHEASNEKIRFTVVSDRG